MAVPRKRLQNNTVYIYFCVYITTDVAGDFLKSFYWDNHSCLQWRLGDLVAGKGQMWKRDQAQSWVENISCGGGKKKKKWFREEMWDKRTIYLFSKKVSPKNRFFRIYEICSWAASKPEMKTDRTCQAGCWGGSVPACSAPHPSACLEGTCQIWLSSHGKWSWCGFDFVCLFLLGQGGTAF